MKIAVVSFCGTVGKSALSKNLLLPRLDIPSENLFEVETINSGLSGKGVEATKVKARDFDLLIDEIMKADSALVDVGHSNVEEFFLRMEKLTGSHEEFDYFIVPITPNEHTQTEGKKAILSLAALGVPKDKIRVVFNMIDIANTNMDTAFSDIISLRKKYATVNTDAVVFMSPLFDLLNRYALTIPKVMADPIDYRKELPEIKKTSPDKVPYYLDRIAIKRHAISTIANLDEAFAQLAL